MDRLDLRKALATLVVALVPGWTTAAFAEEAAEATVEVCAAGVAEASALRVQARYDGIRDLAAKFEQESESATFAGASLMDEGAKTGDSGDSGDVV